MHTTAVTQTIALSTLSGLKVPRVPTQAHILITPEEPWGLITVGGQSIDLLLDTGATCPVLTESPGSFPPDLLP